MKFLLTVFVVVVSVFGVAAVPASAASYVARTCDELQAIDDLAPYTSGDTIHLRASFSCDTVFGEMHNFNANFAGNGHTLTLTGDDPLFDTIDGGTVRDLHLAGSIDGGGAAYVGALASLVDNGSLVERVHSSVDISNTSSYAGGLAGQLLDSTMRDVYVSGDITSNTASYTGGLVGRMSENSLIENAYVSGAVTGGTYAGGLVGFVDNLTGTSYIRDSFFVGVLTAPGSNYGAIAGLIFDIVIGGGNIALDNNYYDTESVVLDICAISTPSVLDDLGDCEAVDGLVQTAYFLDNHTNAPLDAWDFSSVWYTNISFPKLRIFGSPGSSGVFNTPRARLRFACKDQRAVNYNPFSFHISSLCRY